MTPYCVVRMSQRLPPLSTNGLLRPTPQHNAMSLARTVVGVVVPAAALALYQAMWWQPHRWGLRRSRFADSIPCTKKIAHRGSRSEGLPENTIAAFKHALELGADVIECDVWLTTDKEVVVHHDESLLRMTGVDVKVHESRYADFPKITVDQDHTAYDKADLERIPRFVEVLKLLPADRAIIIEFKQDSWELIEAVHKIIQEVGKKDRVIWFSLQDHINKKLRGYDRSIPTITSVPGMMAVLLYYYLGILPWVDLDDAIFGITVEEIPLTRIRNEKALKNVPDWVKRVLAWIFQGRPPHMLVLPKLFAHLRRRGIPVWFMGVNDEEEFKLAVEAGATGVLTDRIDWLCQTKAKNPHMRFKALFE